MAESRDRERMVNDLRRLGLYATAGAVRSGREPISEGPRHVREYCLPKVERWIEDRRRKDAESPPIPGTVGASMLSDCEARRDELRAFLTDWSAYDFASQPTREREDS